MKTPEQVKAELRSVGMSQSEWARKNGFLPNQVSRVLNRHDACIRGECKAIAKKLGISTPLKPLADKAAA